MKQKNIFFLILLFCINTSSVQARSPNDFKVNIGGLLTVCPGASNVEYTANKNFSGNGFSFTKLVWTCGGVGLFQESNSTTLTTLPDISGYIPIIAHVSWNNSNGIQSWVQATFYYSIAGINNTRTGTVTVDIGITAPSSMSLPSICINSSRSYTITCLNSLPTGADSYLWSVSNATGLGSSSGPSVTFHAIANSANMAVSVKFYSSTCNIYSSPYSKTLFKATAAPTGFPTVTSKNGFACEWHFKPSAGSSGLQRSTNNTTWVSSFGDETVIQGQNKWIYYRSVNDCGPGPSKQYHLVCPSCPNCPK